MINKLIILNKKTLPRYIIFISLVGIIISIIILRSRQISQPSSAIIPGKTTIETLLEKQQPHTTRSQDGKTEYYSGDTVGRNSTTYVEQNGIIEYYLERDPQKFIHSNYGNYLATFGQPNFTRYNDWYIYGKFEVHVFLKPGLAITVQPESKTIIEEWHFTQNLPPELFDANYKSLFSPVPPTPSNQF